MADTTAAAATTEHRDPLTLHLEGLREHRDMQHQDVNGPDLGDPLTLHLEGLRERRIAR